MKRIFIFIATLGLVLAVHAQCGADSTGSKRQVSLTLGVQGGATLFTTGNTLYDSPYGLKLQIPLVTTIPLSDRWQLVTGLRYDFLDRNGSGRDGILNMPAAMVNYYVNKAGLKLTAMYQFTGRYGHKTQLDRDNDDLGLSTHAATLQLQYSF